MESLRQYNVTITFPSPQSAAAPTLRAFEGLYQHNPVIPISELRLNSSDLGACALSTTRSMWSEESEMIQVLVHHEVADYQSWRTVFDAAIDFRHAGGECSCRVFRKAGDPNDLTLLFEWEDLARAQCYMNSEELRKKMKQAGVVGPPEILYLSEMYTIRRSAAD